MINDALGSATPDVTATTSAAPLHSGHLSGHRVLRDPLTWVDPEQALAAEALWDQTRAKEHLVSAFTGADAQLIAAAFDTAAAAHAGVLRTSGAPYLSHPAAVADILLALSADAATVAAALCHDVLEDCPVTVEQLVEALGGNAQARTVVQIVDGVTKIAKLRIPDPTEAAAANLRKLISATVNDERSVKVKLADRLHNARTFGALAEPKRRRLAQETLTMYAPLAHRAGINEIRWQLEDLSFAVLRPQEYAELAAQVAERAPARDALLAEAVRVVQQEAAAVGLQVTVTGRAKHLYSIYEKMTRSGCGLDDVHDLLGIRVVVEDVIGCYTMLGMMHAAWPPVDGRFKDFIASPRFNHYQSLHSVALFGSVALELQIRTAEMHARAEYGVAAHWRYKDAGRRAQRPDWQSPLVNLDADTSGSSSANYLTLLAEELSHDELIVLTPAGDMITLPAGATALDFAFAVHTQVGLSAVSAKVAGRPVPLGTALRAGDVVEVVTSKTAAGPRPIWMDWAKTSKARARIRAVTARARHADDVVLGRAALERAAADLGLAVTTGTGDWSSTWEARLQTVARQLGYGSADDLAAFVADGSVPVKAVTNRLQAQVRGDLLAKVHVDGDVPPTELAVCCHPRPPEAIMVEVVGEPAAPRGLVHRDACLRALPSAPRLRAEWHRHVGVRATLTISALDRPRLLADVAASLADVGVDIESATISTGQDAVAMQQLVVTAVGAEMLEAVQRAVHAVDGVFDATVAVLIEETSAGRQG